MHSNTGSPFSAHCFPGATFSLIQESRRLSLIAEFLQSGRLDKLAVICYLLLNDGRIKENLKLKFFRGLEEFCFLRRHDLCHYILHNGHPVGMGVPPVTSGPETAHEPKNDSAAEFSRGFQSRIFFSFHFRNDFILDPFNRLKHGAENGFPLVCSLLLLLDAREKSTHCFASQQKSVPSSFF